jgi:transcriptional regulator with XRE-family HTH domain
MSTTTHYVWLDGAEVRRLRLAKGLTQRDVTDAMAGLGCTYGFSPTRISNIETGNDGGVARGVTPWEATVLGAVLGESAWGILIRDPDPRIEEARALVDELAEQNAQLTAKLAGVLATRNVLAVRGEAAVPEVITLKRLLDE